MANDIVVSDTTLPGAQLIEVPRFDDERGWFAELWNEERYRANGLDFTFAQANVSFSRRGVLRGMHFQWPSGQGKLVSVLSGVVFDAVIDVRVDSPTFGRWYGCELSYENRKQLWAPVGFAHGFLVLSDTALVHYSCTVPYERTADRSVAWDDPDVAIEWPMPPVLVSPKDRDAPRLASVARSTLPHFGS